MIGGAPPGTPINPAPEERPDRYLTVHREGDWITVTHTLWTQGRGDFESMTLHVGLWRELVEFLPAHFPLER